jgi:uncharacterized protein (TIGR02596 family)
MERPLAMSRHVISRMHPLQVARRRSSYTLVELLVVMAIVAILLAATIPAITSLIEGDSLGTGAQEVADQINFARQLSSSQNINVELRLFKLAGAAIRGYTALQMGTNTSTALWVPISRLSRLPQNIVISESTNLSTAFSAITPLTMTNSGPTCNATYYPVEFRPLGIVAPVTGITSCNFTIVPARDATLTSLTNAGQVVKNYAIVQVNPVTSISLVFRP